MRRLTEAEGVLLGDAKRLLDLLASDAQEESVALVLGEPSDRVGAAQYNIGILYSTFDRGSSGIFDVLNCLNAYADDPVARAALDRNLFRGVSEAEAVAALEADQDERLAQGLEVDGSPLPAFEEGDDAV